MRWITTPSNLKNWRQDQGAESIGLVPTMGALHDGHRALIEKSLEQNQKTVVSIFLNPTQFDNPEDLKTYPKTFKQDQLFLEKLGVDVLFAPQTQDMYPDLYTFQVIENSLSQKFCGAHRPGHFSGVLTVVLKLLLLIQPRLAYFGEKDYQQLLLIKYMVEAFFVPVRLVAVPTVRELDGLAMSSRNTKLDSEQRQLAVSLNETLAKEESAEKASRKLVELGFDVDYVEDFDGRRLAAVNLGDVRLIDNVSI